MCRHIVKMLQFWLILSRIQRWKSARRDQVTSREYSTMSETCSGGVTYPVTIVVYHNQSSFWTVSLCSDAQNEKIVWSSHQTFWRIENLKFLLLFETQNFPLTQLQAPVENFLGIAWVWYGYSKVTSDYKLLNARTLVIVRQIQHLPDVLVQNVDLTSKKKRGPLSVAFSK